MKKGKQWDAIVSFIQQYRRINRMSPTLKEISMALYGHEENDGNVSTMVDRMIEAGILKRAQEGAKSRALLVVSKRKERVEG
jgi:hypothetical protein